MHIPSIVVYRNGTVLTTWKDGEHIADVGYDMIRRYELSKDDIMDLETFVANAFRYSAKLKRMLLVFLLMISCFVSL